MDLLIHNKYLLKQVFNPTIDGEYLLKGEVSGRICSSIEDVGKDETVDKKWQIVCVECSQGITVDFERIEVNGAHEHTFINPSGIIFQIGCFTRVFETKISGSATEQWCWFKDYSWRMVCCDRCGTHLGWVYMANGEIRFFGLIINRLSRLN